MVHRGILPTTFTCDSPTGPSTQGKAPDRPRVLWRYSSDQGFPRQENRPRARQWLRGRCGRGRAPPGSAWQGCRECASAGQPYPSHTHPKMGDSWPNRHEAIALDIELLEEGAGVQAFNACDAILSQPQLSQLGTALEAFDSLNAVRAKVEHAKMGARLEASNGRELVTAPGRASAMGIQTRGFPSRRTMPDTTVGGFRGSTGARWPECGCRTCRAPQSA